MNRSNSGHGLPVLENLKDAKEGSTYRLKNPIDTESIPVDKNQKIIDIEKMKRKRKFTTITIKVVDKINKKVVFKGHKTTETAKGKYKTNKKFYEGELPFDLELN